MILANTAANKKELAADNYLLSIVGKTVGDPRSRGLWRTTWDGMGNPRGQSVERREVANSRTDRTANEWNE